MNIKVKEYNYRKDTSDYKTRLGFIAQDLLPALHKYSLISKGDSRFWNIKPADLVFVLWNVVQQQQEQINDMKNIINNIIEKLS